MLFDLLGPIVALTTLATDSILRLATLAPLGAIPIWDQYSDLLRWALNSLADIFGSGGLAIIAFTIIIKTALLPLTVKSIRSSKNMQELAPKIKELQKKYGKDRQRISQETMALYQQHGVNPMAGCLPMVLQIPIFFGLYHAINNLSHSDTGVWHQGFLWISSLNQPDPYKILPILAGIFQFVQARMMRPAGQKVTDPQQQMMNTMMNFMPLMVIVFGWNFASGPVIYWVTQAIYSVVQQWLITGWGSFGEWFPFLPELPTHRRLGYQDPSKRPVVVMSGEAGQQKGFGGWINRKMTEAQETAQQRQETAASKNGASSGKAGSGSKTTSAKGNSKAASTESSEEETEKDEAVNEHIATKAKQRSASYNSRTSGSKFGAKTDSVVSTATATTTSKKKAKAADPTDASDEIIDAEIVESTEAKPAEMGKRRTTPQKRPTG